MNKNKVLFFVFVLVSISNIIGIIFKFTALIVVSKPLILISLLVLYLLSVTKRTNWYLGALVFSFFGDVLLLNKGMLFFIMGLLSFLVAHLLFIKIVIGWLSKSLLRNKIIAIVPFIGTFLGLIYVLKDNLNELLIPVIIYGITISLFGVLAFLNYLNTKNKKAFLMFLGAIVFIASDSILAINKFYLSKDIFNVLVMMTYITAQYLIYKSMIQKEES